MYTPAHLIFAAAVFARPGQPRRTTAALLGGLAPDLSLNLLAGRAMVLGIPASQIFDELYYSTSWQAIFAVDNSFLVWGAVLTAALLFKTKYLGVFAAAGLLHLAFDFPLHHDDGRAHFWPLSTWVFESPISYWDPRAYGHIVGMIEGLTCIALLVLLWRRFSGVPARIGIALAGLGLAGPMLLFGLLFS